MVDFNFYIGIIGMSLILIAFVLSSLDKISRGSYRYMAINGFGAFTLVYYAIVSNVIPFAILNFVWGSVEIYYLIKKLIKRK